MPKTNSLLKPLMPLGKWDNTFIKHDWAGIERVVYVNYWCVNPSCLWWPIPLVCADPNKRALSFPFNKLSISSILYKLLLLHVLSVLNMMLNRFQSFWGPIWFGNPLVCLYILSLKCREISFRRKAQHSFGAHFPCTLVSTPASFISGFIGTSKTSHPWGKRGRWDTACPPWNTQNV